MTVFCLSDRSFVKVYQTIAAPQIRNCKPFDVDQLRVLLERVKRIVGKSRTEISVARFRNPQAARNILVVFVYSLKYLVAGQPCI